MFSRNRDDTTRAEQPGGISPAVHSVLAVFSSKEPRHRNKSDGRGINISGVDFWHAVEFSRNGRFLCTHPRDSLVAFLRALPFGLAFPTLSDRFRSDFLGAFRPFGLPAVSTLSDPLGVRRLMIKIIFPAIRPFRRLKP